MPAVSVTHKALRRIATALALFAILGNLLACAAVQTAAQQQQKDSNDLKQIGVAWLNYLSAHQGNAPSKAEDLFPFLEGESSSPSQALKSGRFILYYDVSISDMTTGPGSVGTAFVILGHSVDTPSSGGLVLMADGTVKQMSSLDYRNTRKAIEFKKKKK